MKGLRRIIWAIDPLGDEKGTKNQSARLLRLLARKTGAAIEPVSLLSDGLLGITVEQSGITQGLLEPYEEALRAFVAKSGLPKLAKPVVLKCIPSSRGSASGELDRYARRRKADLIVVNSHGSKGVKRALLGSFAETLILHAKTPVLVAGPHSGGAQELKQILFPTDFSRKSRKAFEMVTDLARGLGASVTLLHAVPDYLDMFIRSGAALVGGGYVTVHDYADQGREDAKEKAGKWAEDARKIGVKVDVVLDVDSESVTRAILEQARKKKPGFIAMASESGAVSAALLGSVGRAVAREADCPVWFLHA